MLRLLLVVLAALAVAAPAFAFTRTEGTLTMDDGVSIATTLPYTPVEPGLRRPCVSAPRAGVTVVTGPVRVVIPARKK